MEPSCASRHNCNYLKRVDFAINYYDVRWFVEKAGWSAVSMENDRAVFFQRDTERSCHFHPGYGSLHSRDVQMHYSFSVELRKFGTFYTERLEHSNVEKVLQISQCIFSFWFEKQFYKSVKKYHNKFSVMHFNIFFKFKRNGLVVQNFFINYKLWSKSFNNLEKNLQLSSFIEKNKDSVSIALTKYFINGGNFQFILSAAVFYL